MHDHLEIRPARPGTSLNNLVMVDCSMTCLSGSVGQIAGAVDVAESGQLHHDLIHLGPASRDCHLGDRRHLAFLPIVPAVVPIAPAPLCQPPLPQPPLCHTPTLPQPPCQPPRQPQPPCQPLPHQASWVSGRRRTDSWPSRHIAQGPPTQSRGWSAAAWRRRPASGPWIRRKTTLRRHRTEAKLTDMPAERAGRKQRSQAAGRTTILGHAISTPDDGRLTVPAGRSQTKACCRGAIDVRCASVTFRRRW